MNPLSFTAQIFSAANNQPSTYYAHHECAGKLSDKQLNHNIKLRKLAITALRKRIDAEYKAAFKGATTASEIIARLPLNKKTGRPITRQGVLIQLRKYRDLGVVKQDAGCRNRERLWSWVGK